MLQAWDFIVNDSYLRKNIEDAVERNKLDSKQKKKKKIKVP